jgi:hypothetical protein
LSHGQLNNVEKNAILNQLYAVRKANTGFKFVDGWISELKIDIANPGKGLCKDLSKLVKVLSA